MLLVSYMPDAGGAAACGREVRLNRPSSDSSTLAEQNWVCFGHTCGEAIGLAASSACTHASFSPGP